MDSISLHVDNSEVVRIVAKKYDGYLQPEYKKLCVDPCLTTYEILRRLLAHAFGISGDFCVSYLSKDDKGHDAYLTLLSDWDLETAFQSASLPSLVLKVDMKPFEDTMEDWDIVGLVASSGSLAAKGEHSKSAMLMSVMKGSIVKKTVSQVGKAIGLKSADSSPQSNASCPLTDAEFKEYLDNVGHLTDSQAFRLRVFQSGIEPALRKVAWRHLLNIYPENMNGRERFDYLKFKGEEYLRLRQEWTEVMASEQIPEEMRYVAGMVCKDVLRTDRQHDFFFGADDSPNLKALNNILVTYALVHPSLSYCQGMSDFASVILIIQEDESNAYVCFCGLMERIRANFNLDGEMMRLKFNHLSLLLQHYDPAFFAWLHHSAADDLLFCYRWLLLELKREFPLDDALHLFEVMWSSMPPCPPADELHLYEADYRRHWFDKTIEPGAALVATRLQRLRSRSLTSSLVTGDASTLSAKVSQQAPQMLKTTVAEGTSMSAGGSSSVDEVRSSVKLSLVNSSSWSSPSTSCSSGATSSSTHSASSQDLLQQRDSLVPRHPLATYKSSNRDDNIKAMEDRSPGSKCLNAVNTAKPLAHLDTQDNTKQAATLDGQKSITIRRDENGKYYPDVFADDDEDEDDDFYQPLLRSRVANLSDEVATEDSSQNSSIEIVGVGSQLPSLPSPEELGSGNPFLLFVCLAMLLQHRDRLMQSSKLEYDEVAMTFDKMVRKHQVFSVLEQARSLYSAYIRSQLKLASTEAGGDC